MDPNNIALEVQGVYVEAELMAHMHDSMNNFTMETIFSGLTNNDTDMVNQTHCFWSTVLTSNVTNVCASMTIHTLHISPDTQSSTTTTDDLSFLVQLDKFVDNLIHLFLLDYQRLVFDLVQGVFQNPLRHTLNDYLEHLLASAANKPCTPATTNSTPHYLQFDTPQHPILTKLDTAGAYVTGIEKANEALQCVDDLLTENHLLEGVFMNWLWEIVVWNYGIQK